MAVVLDELVIKLSADIAELRSSLDSASKATKNATESMGASFEKASKSLFGFNSTFTVFLGNTLSTAATKAFGLAEHAAMGLFDALVTDGIKSAQAEEDAVNRLNNALLIAGKYSQATSKDLREFANSLQETTRYGNDTIVSSMGLIESLGQLDEKGLKRATRAALDLAAGLGIDLQQAAQMVGKAAAGEVGSFTRYGLAIEEGATRAETFARALDAINGKFGGSAAGQVKTFSGAIDQLKNAWDDVIKITGQAIIQNQSVINVMAEVGRILSATEKSLRENKDAMHVFVSDGVLLAIDAISLFGTVVDYSMRIASGTINGITAVVFRLASAFSALAGLASQDMKALSVQLALAGDATEKAFKSSFEKPQWAEKLDAITASLHRVAKEGFGEAADASDDLAARASNNLDTISSAQEAEIRKEIDKIMERNEILQALDDERYASEIENNRRAIDEKLAQLNQEATETLKIKKTLKDNDQKLETQRLGAAKDALNDLAVFQNSKNKELAAIGKAAAISSTIISTYEGAQKAFTALAGIPFVGPFLGGAAAAAAVAGGLARVAMISGTPLAGGIDSVPGIGSEDNFPAILMPRERVITQEQNQDLTQFLRDVRENGFGPASGGSFTVEISFKGDASEYIEAKLIEKTRLNTRLGVAA